MQDLRTDRYLRTFFLGLLGVALILKGTQFRTASKGPPILPHDAPRYEYDGVGVGNRIEDEPERRPSVTRGADLQGEDPRSIMNGPSRTAPASPDPRRDVPPDRQNASFALDFSVLLEKVLHEKQALRQKLRGLYGDYYEDMFEPVVPNQQQSPERRSIGKHVMYKSPSHLPGQPPKDEMRRPLRNHTTTTSGWDRMVRKFQIKILQAQSTTPTASSNIFRWMTTGNGPASGSGNMFHETSTSMLATTAQPLFRAVGLRFEARNYAIQALSSGDEVALCAHELYGSDYDILFWDFGMTDEQDIWKLALFAYRTLGLNTERRPALMASLANLYAKQHAFLLGGFEQRGMTVLAQDMAARRQQQWACPDSEGRSRAEREALPPHVRYIRCGKQMEEGGPKTYDNVVDGKKMCRHFQFNRNVCPRRYHQNIWHPGWKVSALNGYTLALTLQELLVEAVEKLVQKQQQHPHQEPRDWIKHYLTKLDTDEERDHRQLLEAPGLPELDTWFSNEAQEEIHSHIDLNALFRRPAVCRTALLPSISRTLQTEETRQKIPSLELQTNPYNQTFERGVMSRTLKKFERVTNKHDGGYRYPEQERNQDMILITDVAEYYVGDEGNDDGKCSENRLAINHMDAFVITSSQGWRSLTFPSPTELRYNTMFRMDQSQGWLFLKLTTLLKNCPDDDLHDRVYGKPFRKDQDADALLRQYGVFQLTVNDVPVSRYEKLIVNKKGHLDNSLALSHQGEHPYVWKPNDDGQYVLRGRIANATDWSYVKISSVVLM